MAVTSRDMWAASAGIADAIQANGLGLPQVRQARMGNKAGRGAAIGGQRATGEIRFGSSRPPSVIPLCLFVPVRLRLQPKIVVQPAPLKLVDAPDWR